MRVLKAFVILFFAAALLTSGVLTRTAGSQSGPAEAPAGFDNQTNGFTDQLTFDADRAAFEEREEKADGLGPVYNAQACSECHQNPVTGGVSQIFELRAGLGPQPAPTPVPTPLIPSPFGPPPPPVPAPSFPFIPAPGGSLIQARAVDPSIQERVADGPRIVFMGAQQLISVMGFDGGQYGSVGTPRLTGSTRPSRPTGRR